MSFQGNPQGSEKEGWEGAVEDEEENLNSTPKSSVAKAYMEASINKGVEIAEIR